MVTLRLVAELQILVVAIEVLMIVATPMGYFEYYGYGAFTLGNTGVIGAGVCTVVASLFLAYSAWKMGWKTSGKSTLRYARNTLIMAIALWFLAGLTYSILDSDAMGWAAYGLGSGWSWWVGPAFYAIAWSAVLFTALGVIAYLKAKKVSASVSEAGIKVP